MAENIKAKWESFIREQKKAHHPVMVALEGGSEPSAAAPKPPPAAAPKPPPAAAPKPPPLAAAPKAPPDAALETEVVDPLEALAALVEEEALSEAVADEKPDEKPAEKPADEPAEKPAEKPAEGPSKDEEVPPADPLDQLAALARGENKKGERNVASKKKGKKKKDLLSDLPADLAGLVVSSTEAKAPTRRVVKRTKFSDGLDDSDK